jgi:hypothetical protein
MIRRGAMPIGDGADARLGGGCYRALALPLPSWRKLVLTSWIRTTVMSIASVAAPSTAAIAQQVQNLAQARSTQAAATAQAGTAGQTAAAAQNTVTQQTTQAHHHHHGGGGAPPSQAAGGAQTGTGGTTLNTIA